MSSQSVAITPGAVKTPIVQPRRSTAKKRAVSPLSLWVKKTSSRVALATIPLDSAMCGSWNVKSGAGAADAPAGRSATIATTTTTTAAPHVRTAVLANVDRYIGLVVTTSPARPSDETAPPGCSH